MVRDRGRGEAQGDIGPQTPAQLSGAEIVTRGDRADRWRQKIRRNRIALMARSRRGRRPLFTLRQVMAAEELERRWERLEAGGESAWARPFVDSSARAGSEPALTRLRAQRQFDELWAAVPHDAMAAVRVVVLQGRPIRPGLTRSGSRVGHWIEVLREGLDAVADVLRLPR